MLSAFTAKPIVELKQRDKSKIESILAYGTAPRGVRLQAGWRWRTYSKRDASGKAGKAGG
jgi:hypothetical protein